MVNEDPIDEKPTLPQVLARHAQALGLVSIAWTQAHEALASIFGMLLTPEMPTKAWAAWHAVGNDRSQRAMLKALMAVMFAADDKRKVELDWVLDRLNSYEDKRNNALHSPYTIEQHPDGRLVFIPNHYGGNKRAKNLHGKELLTELKSYTDHLAKLSAYLGLIQSSLPSPHRVVAPTDPALLLRPSLPEPAHGQPQKPQAPQPKGGKRRDTPRK
jgi:hypothetical protein